jgi:MFS family permease
MLFFTNGLLLATWVSRIPAIRTSLGLSHGTLGVVLLGVALGALMAMPVAGWGAARFGSHRVCRVVAVAFCATLPWLATAPGAWWLAVALFCFGAGNGALDVAMNAQAVAVEERYRRPIMSSFHALWSLGGLTGAALGGLAAAAGLSPLAHFTVAAALLGGTTVAVALPRLLDAGEAQVHATNIRTDERRGFAWPPGTIFALGAVGFCIMMGEGAIADWSAIFLRDSVGASEGLAATGYAAFSIAMAAARFLGDALCARFGAVTLVRAGSTLAAVGLAFGLVIDSPAAVLLGFAAVGAGFATIVPQVFSAAGRTPGIAPGPALAMVTTVGYTGFLVGPPLIGFAAEHLGLRAALGIIVAMSAATIVLAPSVGRNNPVES